LAAHRPASDRRAALVALTVAGLAWGVTVPLSKLALGWLGPAWLTVARFAIAAAALSLVARGGLRAAGNARIAAWGAVGYGLVLVLQNLGIERTSVSHAALIIGAVPVLVAVAAVLAGRGAAGPLAWAGFALAFAGVGLLAGSGGNTSAAGDGLVLASVAITAVFIVAQTRNLAGRDPIAVTAVQMGAATLVALPLAALMEGAPPVGPTTAELASVAALATAGTVLPFALFAYGQARVPAETAGVFVNIEPLVGTALGALAFHDPFGPLQLLGAVAVLAGVALASERRPRRPGRRRGSAGGWPELPTAARFAWRPARAGPGRRR
jgi:drug/metabolite transporter (DMT)-like permease